MIKRDYHYHKLDEALRDADGVVASVRLGKKVEDVEFITGHGVIRMALIDLLREYGLNPTIHLGNTGIVVCTVE